MIACSRHGHFTINHWMSRSTMGREYLARPWT
jgi:hypothetical protein